MGANSAAVSDAVAVPTATSRDAAIVMIVCFFISPPSSLTSKRSAWKSLRPHDPLRLAHMPPVVRSNQGERSPKTDDRGIDRLYDTNAEQVQSGRSAHRVHITVAGSMKAIDQPIRIDGCAWQRLRRSWTADGHWRLKQLQGLQFSPVAKLTNVPRITPI